MKRNSSLQNKYRGFLLKLIGRSLSILVANIWRLPHSFVTMTTSRQRWRQCRSMGVP
jgi:hypothetical protein